LTGAQVYNETLEFRGGNKELILAREPDVMIQGAAGTGKTIAAVYKLHFIAMKYPKARILMARKTQEALKTGALATYFNKLKPEQYGVTTYGGSKHVSSEIQYPNGSVIISVGMDKADKVLSTEFDVIYVNEATEISEADWETLRARLRNGVVPYQMIFGDLNPSGVRHWANLRMREGRTRRIVSTHKDNPAFWNPTAVNAEGGLGDWTPLGDQYINQTLAGLTGARRKRLLKGEWASAEGLVYDSFDPDYHVREVDTKGWRAVMGVDIGTKNPTCILSVFQRGQDDAVHIGREFYQRGLSSQRILDAIRQEARRINPDFIAIDPSAVGYILDLQREGFPAYPADNDILVGIQRVKTVIDNVTEPPLDDDGNEVTDGFVPEHLFSVDPNCENLIDEFGMYAFSDTAKIENDKPVKEFDHSMDALRYVCSRLVLPPIRVGIF
jgi:PBSX family phage terminase large subunit